MRRLPLEYPGQLGKGVQLNQLLALRRRIERGVFQHPRIFVKEEDGVQSGGRAPG